MSLLNKALTLLRNELGGVTTIEILILAGITAAAGLAIVSTLTGDIGTIFEAMNQNITSIMN